MHRLLVIGRSVFVVCHPFQFSSLSSPGLPDEHGRLQIIRIHTAELRKTKRLGDDVSLEELAKSTKNFSGAEIEGLVRSATSTAMNKLIKVKGLHCHGRGVLEYCLYGEVLSCT